MNKLAKLKRHARRVKPWVEKVWAQLTNPRDQLFLDFHVDVDINVNFLSDGRTGGVGARDTCVSKNVPYFTVFIIVL